MFTELDLILLVLACLALGYILLALMGFHKR